MSDKDRLLRLREWRASTGYMLGNGIFLLFYAQIFFPLFYCDIDILKLSRKYVESKT